MSALSEIEKEPLLEEVEDKDESSPLSEEVALVVAGDKLLLFAVFWDDD